MSSEDRGPQGSAVLEAAGGRSRAMWRTVRETAAAAIGVSKTRPYKSRRGVGRRYLARRGPRYRGRGEAAWVCFFTAEPFRTATVDRRGGPVLTAPYGILPSPVFQAPARFVGKNRTRKCREDGGTIHV